MLIDAHNHVNYCQLDAKGVIDEMDRFGIDVAWILTWYLPPGQHVGSSPGGFSPLNHRADGTHAGATLDHILQARDRWPDRIVPGYCPCPYEGDAAALFETAYEMHGVRVCGEWSYRMLLDDPRALQLFWKAGELGAPVVLHLDVPFLPDKDGNPVYQQNWYGGGAEPLERTLKACPDTIIVGHAPGFWRYISGDEPTASASYPSGPITPGGILHRLLDDYPNLWADLSAGSAYTAISRDVYHGREFILKHQDRLMFGRDDKGNKLQEFLPTLDLPRDVMEKICYKNALRLVPLDA